MKFYISLYLITLFSFPVFAEKEKSNLTINPTITLEAGFSDNNGHYGLATFEVGLDYSLNDKVEGHLLLLLSQESGEDLTTAVDEVTITLHPSKNISVIAGRQYVPFGQFETNLLSSPLILQLGDTREDALQFNFAKGVFSSDFYLFKDDADGSDKMDDFGLNFGYQSDGFSTGVSYISDVNDLSDEHYSAKGLAIHAKGKIGRTTLIAEHLQVSANSAGNKLEANHVELNISMGTDRILAFSLQKTKNADDLDLAKKAFAIAYHMPLYDKVEVAAEVIKTKAYDTRNNTTVTLQLTYEL
jgi:hypothetical protein